MLAAAAEPHVFAGGSERAVRHWVEQHEAFVKRAERGGIPLLFLGDSLTYAWSVDGRQVWLSDFVPLGAVAFGIGGDRTGDVLWRIENGEVEGTGAETVVLLVGTNDLAKEMRCRLDLMRTPLGPALCLAVAAARAHGLPVLDGVYNEFEDDVGLRQQCIQGADLGFDGKTLIHPRQIGAANEAFSPDAAEVAWSREVIAAFDAKHASDKGVLRIAGRMVERLHLAQARQVVAVAEAIAAIGG